METVVPNKKPEDDVIKEASVESPIPMSEFQKPPSIRTDGHDDGVHAEIFIGCPNAPHGHGDYHVNKEKGIMTCTFCKKEFQDEVIEILRMIANDWGIQLSTLQKPDGSV